MKRPTRITCAIQHRDILLRSVFFLCLLVPLMGIVGMGKGREGAEPKTNTFVAEQGKEQNGKLVLSVRNPIDARPLGNPFEEAHLGQGNKGSQEKVAKPEDALKAQVRPPVRSPSVRGEGKDPLPTQKEIYRVTGVIRGDIPLVLLEGGGETGIYGVGEGPKGYQITAITAHEVWGETGLLYRY